MKISKKELQQIIAEEIQAVLNEKKKTKVKSKADQKKISVMIAKLRDEGKPADQAAAIAYSKYERGELKEAATDYVWGVKGVHRIANKFGGWVPIKRKKSKKRKR